MKVLKFGGTSVGTVESLTNVKRIVDGLESPAIVVVSALGGLTDRLISTAYKSASGSKDYIEEIEQIARRHYDIVDSLVPEDKREKLIDELSVLIDELKNYYTGVMLIRYLPEITLNTIVSFGERMSSKIVACILENAEHFDSLEFIKTEKWFNKNIADRELTDKLIRNTFDGSLVKTVVTGGFISRDRDTGEITNLGRGGSDYTAALIAAALDADELEIWTDVDGFLTSDPRIIKEASIIPEMTFVESMELCTLGAKVIYPPTIYPVFHKNIPIRILNTFNPLANGTLITDKKIDEGRVTGISSLNNTSLIILRGKIASDMTTINSRTYNTLSRKGISVFVVAQPEKSASFSIALPGTDAANAAEILKSEYRPELLDGSLESIEVLDSLSVIAVVGEKIRELRGLGARLVNTLQRNGLDVYAVSDGMSETTISIVTSGEDVTRGLQLIHSACFGS